jgi:acetylornithine deacetylase
VSNLDVTTQTAEMVAIPSVTRDSNRELADYVEHLLTSLDFEVERQTFTDAQGVPKFNVIARKGSGEGGLGFFSHMDTVPGTGWEEDAWTLREEPDRLVGLGACDMKGPLATTIIAADSFAASSLTKPVFIVVTADEETTEQGAREVVDGSDLFRQAPPRYGVVAEPTRLIPVYAHKGAGYIRVIATGVAAHTSTERGTSATFLIAPFLAEMAELAIALKTDSSYQNSAFSPPTLGFNMTIDDGGVPPNVTAAKTVCTLALRPMPNDRSTEVVARITERAEHYGFAVETMLLPPFAVDPQATIVQAALAATGVATPGTVSYGTDGIQFQEAVELVILGPGDIAQAHTKGEWILRSQLDEAITVYRRLIERFCLAC